VIPNRRGGDGERTAGRGEEAWLVAEMGVMGAMRAGGGRAEAGTGMTGASS